LVKQVYPTRRRRETDDIPGRNGIVTVDQGAERKAGIEKKHAFRAHSLDRDDPSPENRPGRARDARA
jgi:hypothetical protein